MTEAELEKDVETNEVLRLGIVEKKDEFHIATVD